MEELMRCPICKAELVEWKMVRMETLDIHIACLEVIPESMAYRCGNGYCPSNSGESMEQEPLVFWNWDGECYGHIPNYHFIDGNNAPFGTIWRKINAEGKRDEKVICVLPLWFPSVLSGMTIRRKWNFLADNEGNILKSRMSFDYLTKDNVYHNWGLNMLSFCLRSTFRNWKQKNKGALNQTIQQKSWQSKEWWRKVNIFFAEKAMKNLENNV